MAELLPMRPIADRRRQGTQQNRSLAPFERTTSIAADKRFPAAVWDHASRGPRPIKSNIGMPRRSGNFFDLLSIVEAISST